LDEIGICLHRFNLSCCDSSRTENTSVLEITLHVKRCQGHNGHQLDLERAVREGRFREDLLYRLNIIQVEIPPLRERREDVTPLALQLLLFFGRKRHRSFQGFTEEALQALTEYEWPETSGTQQCHGTCSHIMQIRSCRN